MTNTKTTTEPRQDTALDRLAIHACHTAAAAAAVVCVVLAVTEHWLASGLVVWLVPGLLFIAGRAHTRRNEDSR